MDVTIHMIFVFRANLVLVHNMGDQAAEGRAFGNLGNTHYLLGSFDKAVEYHEQVMLSSVFFPFFTFIKDS